jgi:hypothetical protein
MSKGRKPPVLVVNVSRTWPSVPKEMTAEESVLGDWASLNEAKLHQYGDAIVGVADGMVVAAYDIEGWERLDSGRVRFAGRFSRRWAPAIGAASPVTWTQGAARPIRYINSDEFAEALTGGSPRVDRDRLTIGGWTLHVGPDGDAIIYMPADCSLTVVSAAPGEDRDDLGR